MQSLLEKLGDEGHERLESLRDRMNGLGASARDRLANLHVRDTARQYAKVTDDYVHHNPWRAIGIGALAGLLIGYLASRR